jgi:hypothetical protein
MELRGRSLSIGRFHPASGVWASSGRLAANSIQKLHNDYTPFGGFKEGNSFWLNSNEGTKSLTGRDSPGQALAIAADVNTGWFI